MVPANAEPPDAAAAPERRIEDAPAPGRFARAALMAGLALGLGAATFAILEPRDERAAAALPAGAAALVNGTIIGEGELDRALGEDEPARQPASPELRDEALDRLIDQELLLQRAYELGMDRSDPTVRNTLLSAMVQSVMASAPAPDTSEAGVRAFYEANASAFARTGRVRVRALKFDVTSPEDERAAQDRADAAVARLRLGESFESVRDELGGALFVPGADGLMPPSQLVAYLGPAPARVVLGLGVGQVSEPVRSGEAIYVLKVIERERGEVPPLENIRMEIIQEMHRRAGEDALRRYLDDLRRASEIRRADP